MKHGTVSRSALAAIVVITASWNLSAAEIMANEATHSGHDGAAGEDTAGVEYAPRVGSTTWTVGPDGNCDYSGLQAAINVALDDDVIRVMDGGGYTGDTYDIHSKAVTIRGGYDDCDSGSTPSGRTMLDAGGSGQVFDIWYPAAVGAPQRQVNLENLIIRGGGGTGMAGGVLVEGRPGRLAVNLVNVEISDNSHSGTEGHGAGLRVEVTGDADGSGAFVTVDNDSIIANNIAEGDGGGVYCQSSYNAGSMTLLRMGTTLVLGNEAHSGGGLAVNGCRSVFLYNGGPIVLIIPAGGFVNNTAQQNGGAVYVEGGGQVYLRAGEFAGFGDPDEAALLAGNEAAGGGAVTVTGTGSRAEIEDAYVINNTASSFGGAFRVISGAELEVRRRSGAGACQSPQSGGGILSRPPCSVIEGNSAQSGGGFSVSGNSSVDLSRTHVRDNTATLGSGSAAKVGNLSISDEPASTMRIEGSLITGNDGFNMLRAENNGIIDVFHSTLADNTGTATLVYAYAGQDKNAEVNFYTSIVLHDGTLADTGGDGSTQTLADCVIGSADVPDTGFTSAGLYSNVDPQFADLSEGDYHLSYTSPAIDYCSGFNPPQYPGLDGNTRGQSWTGPTPDPAPNPEPGDYDLGAYEAVFMPPLVGLSVQIFADDRFIDADQGTVFMQVEVRNNGPEDAAGETQVDDIVPAELDNLTWNCTAYDGATCPADGSGPLSTQIPPLPAGSRVVFVVIADVNPGMNDAPFDYSAMITPSGFDDDAFTSDDDSTVTFETGLFRDGFES